MINLAETVPYVRSDDLCEGDILVFPGGDLIFRVGDVVDDGSYGGDICKAGNFNCNIDWVYYDPEDMINLMLRVFRPFPTRSLN